MLIHSPTVIQRETVHLEEVGVGDGREGSGLVDNRSLVDLLVDGLSVVDHTHQDAGHHHQFCKLFVTLAMQPY
jgi:hypothetical protein